LKVESQFDKEYERSFAKDNEDVVALSTIGTNDEVY
jgi:hypothetical protein